MPTESRKTKYKDSDKDCGTARTVYRFSVSPISAREKRGKLGKAGENGGKRRKLGELKERRNGAAVSFQFPTLYSALGNRNVASTREKHGKYF